MLSSLMIWIFVIIYVEAVTEVIVSGSIFVRFRNAISKKSEFLGDLISCGYCLSVWVSATIAWGLPGRIFQSMSQHQAFFYVDIFVKIFVLHRLSNILHEGISRWIGRYPWVVSISNTAVDTDDDIIDISEEEDGTQTKN